MKRVDLCGQRFGRLQVLCFVGQAKNGNARWQCRCDCGKLVVVDGYRLRKGNTVSCGCYRREMMARRIRENAATAVHIGNADSLHILEHVNISAIAQVGAKNRSGCVGVSFDKFANRWLARMTFRGHLVLNRHFDSRQAAIDARRQAEREYLLPLLEKHRLDRQPTK